MRRLARALVAAGALAVPVAAQGQFANKSIGIHAGYWNLGAVSVRGGGVIGLDGSLYVEHGIDLYVAYAFGFFTAENQNFYLTVPMQASIGARYLFMEESFQPFAGATIKGAFWSIGPAPQIKPEADQVGFHMAVSPNLGFQYFPNQDFSIGLIAEYQLILGVTVQKVPLAHGFTLQLRGATHF